MSGAGAVERFAAARTLPWLLWHRLVLFGLVQAVLALAFAAAGVATPWLAAAAAWPIAVTVTSLCTLVLLRRLLYAEGRRLRDLYRVDVATVASDLRVTGVVVVAAALLATVPNLGLAWLLWGDMEAGVALLVRPVAEPVAWVALLAFPLAVGLSELPWYFGYALPRLRAVVGARRALLLTATALALQHVTIPLLFDVRFVVWRALMFVPFALLLGVVLQRRPRLLPYLVVVHVALDLAVGVQFWLASRA